MAYLLATFSLAFVSFDCLVWVATGHSPTGFDATNLAFRHLVEAALFAWFVSQPWRMWAVFVGTGLALHMVASLMVIGINKAVPVPISVLPAINLAQWLLADGVTLALVVKVVRRSSTAAM